MGGPHCTDGAEGYRLPQELEKACKAGYFSSYIIHPVQNLGANSHFDFFKNFYDSIHIDIKLKSIKYSFFKLFKSIFGRVILLFKMVYSIPIPLVIVFHFSS